MTVENAYQGSKVFVDRRTGQQVNLNELFHVPSMEAKKNPILTDANYKLIGFLPPKATQIITVEHRWHFYNHIYIKSLMTFLDRDTLKELLSHDCFTDTMLKWYDNKLTSCQAHATATFVGLLYAKQLMPATQDYQSFINAIKEGH